VMAITELASAHFEALMRDLLPFIERRLLDDGQVEPFGVTLDESGKGEIVVTRGLELATDKLAYVLDALREQAVSGRAIACLVVTDVDVANPAKQRVSAIRCSFEDSDGSAADFFFPYERPVGTEVVYAESFVMARRREIFGRD
jgi:hypothetical protein